MIALITGNQGIDFLHISVRVLRLEEDDMVTSALASAPDPPGIDWNGKKGRGVYGLLLGYAARAGGVKEVGLDQEGERGARCGLLNFFCSLSFSVLQTTKAV